LLAAVPRLDRGRSAKLATIDGAPPNLLAPPEGCRFRPRCRFAIDKCLEVPPLEAAERGHLVACFRMHEIEALDPIGGQGRWLAEGCGHRRRHADPRHSPRQQVLPRARGLHAPHEDGCAPVNDVTIDIKRGETLGLVGGIGLRQVHPRTPGAAPWMIRRPARSASTISTSRS
jgi:oligopeptide/dipeptide ABC transporter ATP-binding protein